MGQQVFADGIGAISVLGGAVRLELYSFSPTEKEANGLPKAISQYEVVMTVSGFLRAAEKIHEAVDAIGKIGPTQAAGVQPLAPPAEPVRSVPSEPVTVTASAPVSDKPAKPPFP